MRIFKFQRMWDTFYRHSAYIQITFGTCQELAQNLTFTQQIVHYRNQANRTSESNVTACQNSLSEHSFEGVPSSLYNLTKSVPDPQSIYYVFHLIFSDVWRDLGIRHYPPDGGGGDDVTDSEQVAPHHNTDGSTQAEPHFDYLTLDIPRQQILIGARQVDRLYSV